MPTAGKLTPKCMRALQNLAVAGPSTAAELNALDPTAPDHKQPIKALQQSGYVVLDDPSAHGCTRYTLTAKARALLAPKDPGQPSKPVATPSPSATRAKRYASAPAGDNITPPMVHGSLSTKRMTHPCADMLAPATRAGAEQALQVPSRVNDMLHYRDGRRVGIDSGAGSTS